MTESATLPRAMTCPPADKPLRIGFVYNRIPFPMMRGDQLTVANLLSYLSRRGHEVDFFTLGIDGEMSPEQAAWLSANCRQARIYPHGVVDKLTGLFRALIHGLPLQVGIFQNRALTRDARAAIASGEYDILYIYYLRSAPVFSTGLQTLTRSAVTARKFASFLAMQLSQSLNWERIYKEEPNFLKRLLYGIEWKRLRSYEARVWQNFTKTVLIGPKDLEAIESVCRAEKQPEISNVCFSAHGTNTDHFLPAKAEEIVPKRVVFSGSMAYVPNVQGVQWFVDNCWPRIRSAIPDAELVIQGRDPGAQIRRLNGEQGVIVTGTVPDVGAYIRSAAVCIAPIFAAGGMQNKLIEYMSSAKAVVATQIANEGIIAPPDTFAAADDPTSFSDAVIGLLRDPARQLELGTSARRFVEANWTWEAHFAKLESEFYATLDRPAGH